MSSPEDATGGSGEQYDAPNQQVVRPDGSGPADEGEGGSGGESPPAADTQETEETPPDQQVTRETTPAGRKPRGRPTGRRDDDD